MSQQGSPTFGTGGRKPPLPQPSRSASAKTFEEVRATQVPAPKPGALRRPNTGVADNKNIRVICRFRPHVQPAAGYEVPGDDCLKFLEDGQTVVVDSSSSGTQKTIPFTFDKVFTGENTTQEEVYQYSARPSIDDVLEGYNSTIFAYGQTGAGKTHTMVGCPSLLSACPHAH